MEPNPNTVLLYGRPGCGLVASVRAFLDDAAVPYTYVDIRQDYEAAARLRQLTGGFESVPTLVLPGGKVLIEPGLFALRKALSTA